MNITTQLRISASWACRPIFLFVALCTGVCACVCVGRHVREFCLCDAMRNVCLAVGLSQGALAKANTASEGAFAMVRTCVWTLKPSKCSQLWKRSKYMTQTSHLFCCYLSLSLSFTQILISISFWPHQALFHSILASLAFHLFLDFCCTHK